MDEPHLEAKEGDVILDVVFGAGGCEHHRHAHLAVACQRVLHSTHIYILTYIHINTHTYIHRPERTGICV
jgi:hypothetical protein